MTLLYLYLSLARDKTAAPLLTAARFLGLNTASVGGEYNRGVSKYYWVNGVKWLWVHGGSGCCGSVFYRMPASRRDIAWHSKVAGRVKTTQGVSLCKWHGELDCCVLPADRFKSQPLIALQHLQNIVLLQITDRLFFLTYCQFFYSKPYCGRARCWGCCCACAAAENKVLHALIGWLRKAVKS